MASLIAHQMIAEGDGEATRNRFRPICQPYARPVFIPSGERGITDPADLPADRTVCTDCLDIAAAMLHIDLTPRR